MHDGKPFELLLNLCNINVMLSCLHLFQAQLLKYIFQ